MCGGGSGVWCDMPERLSGHIERQTCTDMHARGGGFTCLLQLRPFSLAVLSQFLLLLLELPRLLLSLVLSNVTASQEHPSEHLSITECSFNEHPSISESQHARSPVLPCSTLAPVRFYGNKAPKSKCHTCHIEACTHTYTDTYQAAPT